NRLGTDPTGVAAAGNGAAGLVIDGAPGNQVAGNLIAGNRGDGIRLVGAGASGNVLRGNTIGVNATGSPLGNGGDGVLLDGAPGNQVGVAGDGGNLISANALTGVLIRGGADGNRLAANFIGTAPDGRAFFSNGRLGVVVDGSSDTQIGGVEAGAGNL